MFEISPLLLNAWCWWLLVAVWLIASFFVYPAKVREGFWQRQTHVLPLYLGFFLIFYHRKSGLMRGPLYESDVVRYGGDVLTVVGVAFAIWARITLGRYWSGIITLKARHRLIRNGPYRLARHPLYTGFVVAIIGSAIAAARLDGYIGAAIAIASLIFKLQREEKLLTGEFGDEYQQFRRDVPAAILPGIY